VIYLADNDLPASGAYAGNAPAGAAAAVLESPRPGVIVGVRHPLLGALVAAIGVPLLLAWSRSSADSPPTIINTSIGIFLAIMLGYYALKRICDFPTIQAIGSVFSVFTVSFLLVISLLLLSGLEHSQFSFLTGYVVTVAWFVIALSLDARGRSRQFALAPVGDTLSVRELPGATWRIADPSDPPPVGCDGVVIDLRADLSQNWRGFLANCALAGVPVYHFKHVREALTGRLEIERVSENPLGAHNAGAGYRRVKRAVDFVVALVALIALGPLLLIVGALVRLDSKGPALFRQQRLTRGGKTFLIYKFRTMRAGAARPGSRQDAMTSAGDPRITRLGGFLRKSRIDELPQILNILKGEMSWIGPRPEAAPLAEWYQQRLPFYEYRHMVWPGISGWAQVNQGHVTDPDDVLAKLHYDFYYIKNFSVWLDILIVLKTIRTVLTGFGAR
jgi:lipopolysaccharide/colanic/teichoic acid biosynthesis glycosyltransferase